MPYKPKIAVVALGHYIYFSQFERLKEELTSKSVRFNARLDNEHFDIFDAGFIDSIDEAYTAVRRIKEQDADALIIIMTTYVPSAVIASFAVYLDIPQFIVGIQPLTHLDYKNATTYTQLANDDICAIPEATGVYLRLGKNIPECLIASENQDDKINSEILKWQRSISAYAAFKYASFGYLGHTYEGMYDMNTDPTEFTRSFRSHVKMLEMCELAELAENIDDSEIQCKIDIISNTFEICEPSNDPLTDYVNREDLIFSARMACALDKMVEKNKLTALAYYYKGEKGGKYESMAANLIVGNTLLTSSGIPLAGEADLKTAAAMLIMNRLGGGGSFAEIHPFDTRDNVVLVGHDGPHNISVSDGKPRLRKLKKYHGKSGCGIGVEFSLKAGNVTLLSISVGSDGRLRMVAAEGISIKKDIPQTGNTNTHISFGNDICDFLRSWSMAAPTHHFALGCGKHIDELKLFSKISGIPLTII